LLKLTLCGLFQMSTTDNLQNLLEVTDDTILLILEHLYTN